MQCPPNISDYCLFIIGVIHRYFKYSYFLRFYIHLYWRLLLLFKSLGIHKPRVLSCDKHDVSLCYFWSRRIPVSANVICRLCPSWKCHENLYSRFCVMLLTGTVCPEKKWKYMYAMDQSEHLQNIVHYFLYHIQYILKISWKSVHIFPQYCWRSSG